jgi:1,4-alpha-glucan branching enzyme
LIRLRLNRSGSTRGLTGSGLKTFHQNQADNVIAYHRWHQRGPGDDVVVVLNLAHQARENYTLGFPSPGTWHLRLNSDWTGYSKGFGNHPSADVVANALESGEPPDQGAAQRDGFPAAATIGIGPYSVLIFSQDSCDNSHRPA